MMEMQQGIERAPTCSRPKSKGNICLVPCSTQQIMWVVGKAKDGVHIYIAKGPMFIANFIYILVHMKSNLIG